MKTSLNLTFMNTQSVQKMLNEAHTAGMVALNQARPTPMVVGSETRFMSGDIDYNKPTYFVEGGVCGFAWVHINKGQTKFVNQLKKLGIGRKSYYGGYDIWVYEGGQSMERKMAYANAYAQVLRSYGIECYGDSRMD